MTLREYSIKIVTREEFVAWSETLPRDNWPTEVVRRLAEEGIAHFQIGSKGFTWECPGCGAVLGGNFGDAPVSGWDSPRWVRTGDDAHLTLTPSLGCPNWRAGTCIGHWWARDGKLVLA